MSKRRLSDIVTTAFRSQKHRHLRRRDSSRSYTNIGSLSHPDVEHDVRRDVLIMAAGATGPPVDNLINRTISIDPFWSSSPASQNNDSIPSSSAYLSVALPSPSASSALAQTLGSAPSHWDKLTSDSRRPSQADGTFFLRSDADSLHHSVRPPSLYNEHQLSPFASTSKVAPAGSEQAEEPSRTISSAAGGLAHQTKMPKQTLTSSPSQLTDDAKIAPSHPDRSNRPMLTRLNTSEMLRPRTSARLQPAPGPSNPNRRSPTALKLQLDTSIPRRSATLSSYPHANKFNQKGRLQPTPLSLSPSTSAGATAAGNAAFSLANVAPPAVALTSRAQSSDYLREADFDREPSDFEVSTILPDFLYLGPDVQAERDVVELQARNVRRILNVAYECDEAGPFKLRDRFEHYLKLPMLDNVEAKGVQDSIEQACSFLDDARLRSESVYIHCKAGKSRSVTIAIAYLIHAFGWTLQRSYSHVMERRAGICPNIGFVAELMRFEEKTLKLARSTGIHGGASHNSPSSSSKASTPLLSPWNGGACNDSTVADSAPSKSTPMLTRHDAGRERKSSISSKLVGTLSQSSPDLPSLTFSKT